jgi:hypothetical protein
MVAKIGAYLLMALGALLSLAIAASGELGPLQTRALFGLGLMMFATGLATRIDRPRVRLALVAGVLCLPLTIPLFIFFGKAFDRDQWLDKASTQNGVRQAMADRFLFWGTLNGKSRAEVRALLGEPTSGTLDSEMLYFLGPERWYFPLGAPIFCAWLRIEFRDGDRVLGCDTFDSSNCGGH